MLTQQLANLGYNRASMYRNHCILKWFHTSPNHSLSQEQYKSVYNILAFPTQTLRNLWSVLWRWTSSVCVITFLRQRHDTNMLQPSKPSTRTTQPSFPSIFGVPASLKTSGISWTQNETTTKSKKYKSG
eukprot:633619_1